MNGVGKKANKFHSLWAASGGGRPLQNNRQKFFLGVCVCGEEKHRSAKGQNLV